MYGMGLWTYLILCAGRSSFCFDHTYQIITDFFNRDLVISLEIRLCFKPLHEAAAVKDKAVFWNAEYQVMTGKYRGGIYGDVFIRTIHKG